MGLHNEYQAWCFDEAIWHFGSGVEQDVESVQGKGDKATARKRRARLLYLTDAPDSQRFRPMMPGR